MRQPNLRLIHIIGANRWGQPWRHALDVCRHFKSCGWSITAYTRDAQAIDSRFREYGIDLRHSPLRGFFDIYAAIQLAGDLKAERKGTIVHVHRYRDAFAVLLARKIAGRKDIRVVSTRHKLKPGANNSLARRIYRNLDAQIFISKAVRDRFISTWADESLPFPGERMHIITPTVNIDIPDPSPEPEKGPKIMLCKTPLEPGTGLECLIDALPSLRGLKARLWIVGQGDADYTDSLRRRAQVRGVMDMIDWKLRVADASDIIDHCHIAVDPAIDPSPFGPPHIEYMAHQRPMVISTAVSPSEYVDDSNQALLIPPGDAAALGHALRRLIDDPQLRTSIARNARNTFLSHFAWADCAATLRDLYTSL